MNKTKRKPAAADPQSKVPADLRKALKAAAPAHAAWRDLTPIAQRDFVSWIESARQPETRQRRIERACENLAAGKRRPCCYAVVPMDLYRALGADATAKSCWSGLTSTERRDFSDWIESTRERELRRSRVEKACKAIAAGKRRPPSS